MELKLFIAVVICAVCGLTSLLVSYFTLMHGNSDDEKDIGIISALLFAIFTTIILLLC